MLLLETDFYKRPGVLNRGNTIFLPYPWKNSKRPGTTVFKLELWRRDLIQLVRSTRSSATQFEA